MTLTFGLLATVAMMLNRFVQPVLGARNAVLAIIGGQPWHTAEH
jgi:hypothetical protein